LLSVFINRLKKLYANGNKIWAVPAEISTITEIEAINLANNRITELPVEWLERWGQFIPQLGVLGGSGATSMTPCNVTLLGNSIAEKKV
jgi:Leucine-rich repeat (LRR) protein